MKSIPASIDTSLSGRVYDMRRAFEADAFLSAISLALSLPDICGKYLYPKEKGSQKRYIKWFDRYIAMNYLDGKSSPSQKYYFSGTDCYQLRCVFFHEGTTIPHIERERASYNFIQFTVSDKTLFTAIDHVSQLETDIKLDPSNKPFNYLGLDLANFIDAMTSGVLAFLEDYPEANDSCSLDSFWSDLYNPILDFRP